MIGRARRRWLLAGAGIVAVAVIATVVVMVGGGDGNDGGPPVAAPADAPACGSPAEIRPAALKGPQAWRRLDLAEERRCFTLIADRRDAAGVAVDSTFRLESTEALDAPAARERLVVDPPLPLRIGGEEAGAGSRLVIEPEQPLRPDTIYRFTLLDKAGGRPVDRWAFQSQGRLRVVQTLPADQATGVPTDVGIELTFSHDGVEGVAERLETAPKIDGRFEIHKRTVVFVPKSLAPGTLYTITLRPGTSLPGTERTITEPVVFRFETGAEERGGEAPFLNFSREVWEAPTREAPAMGVFDSGREGGPERLDVEVRRFKGQAEFVAGLDGLGRIPLWAVLARQGFAATSEGTTEVARFGAALERGGPSGEKFIRFPEPLPAGYYLVLGRAGDARAQAWLQVTDLAAYASVSERATLVWVNDVATRAPVAGARIEVAGVGARATTGPDGVALFDTPPSLLGVADDALGVRADRVGNLLVSAGDAAAVVPLSVAVGGARAFDFREYEFAGDPGRFWSFLYSDRSLYRPTDTVNVWGFVRPREGTLPAGEVVLRLGGYGQEGGPVRVARATLPVGPSGTFLGRLTFSGASPGYYSLEASVGDQAVASTSLEVRDFVTPAYQIDVVPSVRAAFAGDDIRYDVTAAFAEGTPVPGARLKIAEPNPAEVTTDASGRASVTRKAGAGQNLYRFNWDRVNVSPAVPEEGEISGGAEVRVFSSALTMESESAFRGDRGVVTGTAWAVDLAQVDEDDPYGEARGAPAAGRVVTAEITETTYNAVETGDYYDFIAKIVRKAYRYDTVRTPRGTFPATTGADGRFEISFPASAQSSYQVVVSAADDAGRVFRDETYLSSVHDYPDFTHLEVDDSGPRRIGAEAAVTLRHGSDPQPAGGPNRYLFLKAQRGIRSYTVQDGPRYAFTFSEADVPSVSVAGVRFTGDTYDEALEPATLSFDDEARRLSVEVAAERGRYRPGEKAALSVRVTDPAGKGVETEVLLSAVDERIFRLQSSSYSGQSDILSDLYVPVSSGLLGSYAAHQRPAPARGGGAEQGEGGDARSDFRDAALFQAVRTGPDGRGSGVFELPDDLTSWRVTGLAVSGDLRAGSGSALVPVGLPVFADVAMNDSYLTSDRPVLRLRAFGEGLAPTDDVAFTVESPTLLGDALTAGGKAFAGVDVPLPALKEGRHQVTIRLAAKGQKDALTRPVSVVRSRLLRAEARHGEVAAGSTWKPDPPPGEGPVRVTLSDHNRGRYHPDVVDLAYTAGDRVDQALARELAGTLLAEHFGEGPLVPSTFRGAPYQTKDGGVAILPFADDDLAVTARVAALAPDRFGRQDLARYLRGVVEDQDETRERAALALFGLAGLGEPVLVEVQALAAASDLSVRERLYGGLAAAALGDDGTARRLYRALLEEHAQVRGETLRLDVGADQDDVLEASALAADLGARLADGLAPALYGYAAANATTDILVDLDRIAFLNAALPRLAGEPVRLSYNQSGQREAETLERGEALVLALARDALGALDLRVEVGTLGVSVSSLVPFDAASVEPDPALKVERVIPKTVGSGDLVRITLRYELGAKAVDGCYAVRDLLPSGLRPVIQPYRLGIEERLAYPYAIEGQRVSFCVYRGSERRPLVYFARVVSAGAYVAEPAVIQSLQAPESMATSAADPVEIR